MDNLYIFFDFTLYICFLNFLLFRKVALKRFFKISKYQNIPSMPQWTKNEIDNYGIKARDHLTREIYCQGIICWGTCKGQMFQDLLAPLGQWSTFNRDCVISMVFEVL